MKMNIAKEWLLKGAEMGDEGFVGVGGLALRMKEMSSESAVSVPDKSAFSTLVELQRRKPCYSVPQLAERAHVEIADIIRIERGGDCDNPETLNKLADVLELPVKNLMRLGGLTQDRDPQLEAAALRFAARSAPMQKLTQEESDALEEFVKILAE